MVEEEDVGGAEEEGEDVVRFLYCFCFTLVV